MYRVETEDNEVGYFYAYVRDNPSSKVLPYPHIRAREEVIVSKIKDFIGPNLAPSSRPIIADFESADEATFEGLESKIRFGVLSKEVGTHDLRVHSGPLRAEGVYDALLFSFLFGGEDHTANFRVLENLGLARIDYEGFLHTPRRIHSFPSQYHYDHLIPRYYTSKILENIKAFGRDQLMSSAGDIMSRDEIENFLFWRLVIIIHSREFPDSVI